MSDCWYARQSYTTYTMRGSQKMSLLRKKEWIIVIRNSSMSVLINDRLKLDLARKSAPGIKGCVRRLLSVMLLSKASPGPDCQKNRTVANQ